MSFITRIMAAILLAFVGATAAHSSPDIARPCPSDSQQSASEGTPLDLTGVGRWESCALLLASDDTLFPQEIRKPRLPGRDVCEPEDAMLQARRAGLLYPQVHRVTSAWVEVWGQRYGRDDRLVFANRAGCPRAPL